MCVKTPPHRDVREPTPCPARTAAGRRGAEQAGPLAAGTPSACARDTAGWDSCSPADAQVRRPCDVRHRERIVRAGVDRLDGRAETDVPVSPSSTGAVSQEAVQVEQGADDSRVRLVPGERLGTLVAQRPLRAADGRPPPSTARRRRRGEAVERERAVDQVTAPMRRRAKFAVQVHDAVPSRGTPCRSAARSGRASGHQACMRTALRPTSTVAVPRVDPLDDDLPLDGDVAAQRAVHLGAPDAQSGRRRSHVAVPVVVVDVRRVPGLAGVHAARSAIAASVSVPDTETRDRGPSFAVVLIGPASPRVPGPRSVSRGRTRRSRSAGQGHARAGQAG